MHLMHFVMESPLQTQSQSNFNTTESQAHNIQIPQSLFKLLILIQQALTKKIPNYHI